MDFNVQQVINYVMVHPSITVAGVIAAFIAFKVTRKMVHTIISAAVTATVWYFLKKYGF